MHGEGGEGGRGRERGRGRGPPEGQAVPGPILALGQEDKQGRRQAGEDHEDEATKEARKGERLRRWCGAEQQGGPVGSSAGGC